MKPDIYRKQLPHFQHILASACALLFLIVAYIEQNRSHWPPEEYFDNFTLVDRSFKKAFRLAATYTTSSLSARRLWNRLNLMQELESISCENYEVGSKPTNSLATTGSSARIRPNKSQPDATPTFPNCDPTDFSLPMQPLSMDVTGMGNFTTNISPNLSHDSFMYEWASGEAGSFVPNMRFNYYVSDM